MFQIRVIIRQVFYLLFKTFQFRLQPQQMHVYAWQLYLTRAFPPVLLLNMHLRQRLIPQNQRPQGAFNRMGSFPYRRAFLPAKIRQLAGIHRIRFAAYSLTLDERFAEHRIDNRDRIPRIREMSGDIFHIRPGRFHADMGMDDLMSPQPADELVMSFWGVGKFLAAVTAIRPQHIDIEFSFGHINADKVNVVFHGVTILANAGYRVNRSMILFGLSLVDSGGPVQASTVQTKSLSPGTASGPPPERTGRFFLVF